MQQLAYLSVSVDVRPFIAHKPASNGVIQMKGSRCIRNARSAWDSPATANCPCGWAELPAPYANYFDRASGAAFGPPPHAGATAATNVRVLRRESYAGRTAYVLRYEFKAATVEGPVNIYRTEWIDADEPALVAPGAGR